jgi:predicted transcriptional regulator of viral defense system
MGNNLGVSAKASTSPGDAVLLLAGQRGVIVPQDLVERDLNSNQLARLARRGLLTRVARGLYASLDAPVSEHHALAEAARFYPKAVGCLLSALQFHAGDALKAYGLVPVPWSRREEIRSELVA